MTPRYPIPADAIPGLLAEWTGPCETRFRTRAEGDKWYPSALIEPAAIAGYWRVLTPDTGAAVTMRSDFLRLDPARPEVAHRIADVLRSLGHEVRALLPRALGGEVGETAEETGCPDGENCADADRLDTREWDCPTCGNTGKVRRPVPAAEAAAKLLAASVAGVVAGRGVVRGVLGPPIAVPYSPTVRARVLLSGPRLADMAWWHDDGIGWMCVEDDAAALALGWALLSPDAPSGVVVPTWGRE